VPTTILSNYLFYNYNVTFYSKIISQKTNKLQAKNQVLEEQLKNAQLLAQIAENVVSVGIHVHCTLKVKTITIK
jgi:DNA-binding protein YbaB